jgi:ATP-binding protein involved in chromosome partitioning
MQDVNRKEEQEKQDKRLQERMSKVKNKILVMSGKGGVGKTTVAVNLAWALAEAGKKVGILDVDIHGPNVAKMLGIDNERVEATDGGIIPISVTPKLKAISIALVGYEPDAPFIWRGPLKMGVIKQFLADVLWEDLDYLVIDSPPGTGDEPLSVAQLIPDLKGSVIVTTPQEVAILDSRKCINFSKQLKLPVLGVIENMSGLICPHCGGEVDLFGKGGGERAAKEMEVPFLGAVPIEPSIVSGADHGKPFVTGEDKSAGRDIFKKMVEQLVGVVEPVS